MLRNWCLQSRNVFLIWNVASKIFSLAIRGIRMIMYVHNLLSMIQRSKILWKLKHFFGNSVGRKTWPDVISLWQNLTWIDIKLFITLSHLLWMLFCCKNVNMFGCTVCSPSLCWRCYIISHEKKNSEF